MRLYDHVILLVGLAFALVSCIGTDIVDVPLGPVPARLELSQAAIILLEGESQQLSARVLSSDEATLEEQVFWSSRAPAVATVDPTGLVGAVSEGQVWIDAYTQTLEDSVLVTVSRDPEALAEIIITNSQRDLAIGDTLQLDVDLRSANGSPLANRAVAWESTNPEVGSVDEGGLVVALANGLTRITASSEGVSSLPFSLMVGGDALSRRGTFQGLNGYDVEGTAILRRSSEGAELVLASDFRSQNGPGLYVYLSANATQVDGGINLGSLQSPSGSQTYPVPASVNPDAFDHVVVYCQPFGVPFGTANLQ